MNRELLYVVSVAVHQHDLGKVGHVVKLIGFESIDKRLSGFRVVNQVLIDKDEHVSLAAIRAFGVFHMWIQYAARRGVPANAMEINPSFNQTVTLADGRSVVIRAVRPDDKPLFTDAIERSSLETVYGRFLTPRRSFSDEELRYLTEFDGVGHFALGAEFEGRGVGVARFVRSDEEPADAELAFAVDEDYRQVGLATALLKPLLVAAEERGYRALYCLVLAENLAASTLLRREGFERGRVEGGLAAYRLNLKTG